MKKKCNFCDAKTDRSREDFAEIGWSAVQFENKKMICACPKHQDNMKRFIKQELTKSKLKH